MPFVAEIRVPKAAASTVKVDAQLFEKSHVAGPMGFVCFSLGIVTARITTRATAIAVIVYVFQAIKWTIDAQPKTLTDKVRPRAWDLP